MLISSQKTLGRALILMGALSFACWGYLVLKQFWFQWAAGYVLEQRTSQATGGTERDDVARKILSKPIHGEIIGRLEIPRIHVSVVVVEGSDPTLLGVAAGHIEGTTFPGTAGNVGIAAHRDTFFRALREIRPNDMISLSTVQGTFRYRVDRTQVVDPSAIEVLQQTTNPELTLVTCYPFSYIGSAPKRFIVHARQQS